MVALQQCRILDAADALHDWRPRGQLRSRHNHPRRILRRLGSKAKQSRLKNNKNVQ